MTMRIFIFAPATWAFGIVLCCSANAAGAVMKPVLFDFGTETSPVAESAVRVTGMAAYDPRSGYGWISEAQRSFDRDQPALQWTHRGNPMRSDLFYRDRATALNRDGVASDRDMVFRIAVEPGRYRVNVWVGDLHTPLESLALECNGRSVAKNVSAKQIVGRGEPFSTGMYRIIRFDTDASSGKLELRFYGDETQYLKDKARYEEWFPGNPKIDSYRRTPWDPDRHLKFDPKGPLVRNSVLAIRVSPHQDPLSSWSGGRLVASEDASRHLNAFVSAVNRGDFAGAEAVLDSAHTTVDLRVRGYLALIGHPRTRQSDEERLLPKAKRAVSTALDSDPNHVWALEAKDSLKIFSRARHRFINRGREGEGHFPENRKVVSMMRMFRPGDLLHYKALQYQGRALQMLDPHRWVYASGDAQAVWKKLIGAFPKDRYARFYLTDRWQSDEEWRHRNHLAGTEGAPAWAVAQKEAFGLLLDVSEWWAANKQEPDGSIGGGWGDDVELVAYFGIVGFISEGASQASLDLATKLIEGMWKYSGVDQEAGFFLGLSDTEHTAEWTGDTLPIMLTMRYGDPIWIERATKTARLMRNLWMDHNDRGDYHFRSNFLAATAIGDGARANDAWINCRAAFPAVAVYQYNHNPVIAEQLTDWADAWASAAMRSERGKPRGVFPAQVGFPTGQLGGIRAPSWFEASHPLGTVNYDWGGGRYKSYLVDLMLLAHQITGEEKYLEPFRLEKRLAEEYLANPIPSPKPGGKAWVGRMLAEGGQDGRGSAELIWHRVEKKLAAGNTQRPPVFAGKQEVLERMNFVRERLKRWWPLMTTETSATDRVAFPGIGEPFFVMAGTRGLDPSVSYAGVGRDFAAFVKHSDHRYLKVVMYNFSAERVGATLIPWKLQLGATYRLRIGTDTNGDDEADDSISEDSFVLQQRGQRVKIPLSPRWTTVIEIDQTHPGRGGALAPDLAVVSGEIRYSIWNRRLETKIHNVGSETARKFTVAFHEGTGSEERKIGEVTVPQLSWPMDLESKTLSLSVPYVPTQSRVPISVVIDGQDRLDEICESNNQATRWFEFDLAEIRAPRNKRGETGGNITEEIRRGLR